MRKVKELIETTDVDYRTFQITFDDESTFEFEVLLDGDEYVLEGVNPDNQGIRYCQAELEAITRLITNLNQRRRK
jgi:hypothetical protein